ncbi:MAG: type IV secretion system DNA-binding domain-containing protein [Tepidanaerobacteraceae bacterium]
MTFVENRFWPISIASGVLAYLALLNETPYANWFIIISAVTGILAVVIGTVRHAVRAILTGVIGLSLGLSAWFGYRLYQNAEGWLTGVAQTGWITPSEIRFAKGLIILFPAVAVIAIALLIRQAQIIKVSDFKPQLQKTGKKGPLDVEVCKVGNRPVIIKHHDRYLHTMCIGTTGTGKSSRVLKPMIEQDLKAIAKGEKLGVTIIEPKGDFADDVAAMCRSLKVPYIYINPLNPATPRFNPMSGEPELVAEIMRTVLRSLFGRQEAFFRLNQEVAARNTALLVKKIKGEDATMLDMVEALREQSILAMMVSNLEKAEGESALTQYFKTEVMGDMKDKMQQFTLGLRLQLEDITGNQMMRRVMIGKSDVDLDKHLAEGGVLIINTAMGELGKLGDAFGQFIMMHFQQAVFRRKGTERTRTPHVLYIDEFPRYVNPDFERLLAIGRSYRCATVLALQTTAQMVHEDRPTFRDIVLETCRNKIILNLGSEEDAKRFSKEFGEYELLKQTPSYKRDGMLIIPWRLDSMREEFRTKERYSYTDLMELPRYHAVVRTVVDGQPQQPVLGKLELSNWDRQRRKKKPARKDLTGKLEIDMPTSDLQDKKLDIIFDEQTEENVDIEESFFDVV